MPRRCVDFNAVCSKEHLRGWRFCNYDNFRWVDETAWRPGGLKIRHRWFVWRNGEWGNGGKRSPPVRVEEVVGQSSDANKGAMLALLWGDGQLSFQLPADMSSFGGQLLGRGIGPASKTSGFYWPLTLSMQPLSQNQIYYTLDRYWLFVLGRYSYAGSGKEGNSKGA
ncbi:hypothetical protein LY78DRAFT_15118 [Colletotrichum sublineola]|nr:hypothetical protein LY78DRAFT_15118 [Colletotrichum sublineola]